MENFALTLFAFASIFTRRDYLFSDEFSHVFTLGQSILDDSFLLLRYAEL